MILNKKEYLAKGKIEAFTRMMENMSLEDLDTFHSFYKTEISRAFTTDVKKELTDLSEIGGRFLEQTAILSLVKNALIEKLRKIADEKQTG